MRAGGLKHRITLQRYEQSQGPLGEPIKRWVDYATIWAEVKVSLAGSFWLPVRGPLRPQSEYGYAIAVMLSRDTG